MTDLEITVLLCAAQTVFLADMNASKEKLTKDATVSDAIRLIASFALTVVCTIALAARLFGF